MAHDVFLSHAAVDRAAAQGILAALESSGVRCWIAPRDIPAGAEYGEHIVDAVKSCRVFVVVFSAAANASPHVRREVERAVSTDRTIVPFRIENVTPSGAMEYCLGGTHWFDAFGAPVQSTVSTFVGEIQRLLGSTARADEGQAAADSRPSVAVLPFTNMSGDPEQEYFSDGITEDVITDLSKVSGLFVIARNTAFTYKGKAVNVKEVCAELGVRYVLEGSVRKAGSRVRVTGQLIDGETGGHVWADRFDRDLTDIFAIQDEITHAIVEQLRVKLLPQEKRSIAQAPTDSIEAYTYYLRGRQFLNRHAKSYYHLARRMFSKAVELDPAYARAYAGIADCDSFLFLHYHEGVKIEQILATSARALELDDKLAEAHASRALAYSLTARYDEAMREFERAIALDPNSFEAHYFFGRACFAQGLHERARSLFDRAAALKPDDYEATGMLRMLYRSLGDDAMVDKLSRRLVEVTEQELARHPENPRPAYLGAGSLALIGEVERARDWLDRAISIDPDDVLTQYNAACVYSLLGDADRAFDLLEKLLPRANHETKSWVRHDSDFDGLRQLPRYQRVIELTG